MADDITTRPIEAMLEGQRELASMVGELNVTIVAVSKKLDELLAKQDQLAARQDGLDARMDALTREVRDGLDENNRKIEALNKRLLSFETWLSRIDDRLHDEITARTR